MRKLWPKRILTIFNIHFFVLATWPELFFMTVPGSWWTHTSEEMTLTHKEHGRFDLGIRNQLFILNPSLLKRFLWSNSTTWYPANLLLSFIYPQWYRNQGVKTSFRRLLGRGRIKKMLGAISGNNNVFLMLVFLSLWILNISNHNTEKCGFHKSVRMANFINK